MNTEQSRAHASIGLAVISCQALEMLFALCVRLVFKNQSVDLLKDITPLEKNFSKPSMKVILGELRRYVDVSNEFENRLLDLIERRHILIHRWGIEYGLPDNDATHVKIREFSNILARDANGLSNVLYEYIAAWLKKFPEFQEVLAKNETISPSRIPKELRNLKIT